jgi:O-methyltransferase involved in polyketide biosynthesis
VTAINGTLSFIKANFPKSSALCFDYPTGKMGFFNALELFQSWIGNGQESIESFVSPFSFRTIEHIDSKEMERRFLAMKYDSVAEKRSRSFAFIPA